MKTIHVLPVSLLCLFFQACSVSGVRRISMVHENKCPVKGVAVVPLVRASVALSAGPDGDGPSLGERTYLAKPFEWSSGDNLMKEHLQCKGAMLWPFPPFIGATRRRWVEKWLILAKDCDPLVLTMNEISSNSYVDEAERDPTDRVFVLRHGTGNNRGKLVDALVAPQPKVDVIGRYLGAAIEGVDLDRGSVDLLCRQR